MNRIRGVSLLKENCADILRGSLDSTGYRLPVRTLLFLKRLNNTFEENPEKLIQERKSEKEVYCSKNRHYFFVPEEVRWTVLSTAAENMVNRRTMYGG